MKFITPEAEHGIVHRFPNNTCFKYNGWPSVCKDDRGVLYAAASSMRMSHVDPTGKNCMYVSFNEGKHGRPPLLSTILILTTEIPASHMSATAKW